MKTPLFFVILTVFCFSCKEKETGVSPSQAQYAGWEAASHSSQNAPDYATVFPKDRLQTLEITLRKSTWDSLNAKQTENYFGIGFGTAFNKVTTKQNQLINNNFTGSYIGKAAPTFVEAQLKFNNKTWRNVGLRYDGVISLIDGWTSGVRKLPFQIQANAFEDKFTETRGQKMYGFQRLSLEPGYGDNALISNKLSSDIFNENGIQCPRKAFYKVYINYGDGNKYFGVYTISELPEDTFVNGAFGSNTNNIYQPFSSLNSFSKGFMVKKNNVEEGSFTDIETLVSVLNSTKRTTDKALWLERLNKQFDVERYLKWLAINTAIRGDENHDEGFGLYNQSDFKMAYFPFQTTYCFKFPATTTTTQPDTEITVDLGYTKVSDQYPLIKFLLAEPQYFAKYKTYVKEFNEKYFIPEKINAIIDQNQLLISAAVAEEARPFSQLRTPALFATGVSNMKDFVGKQKVLLNDFVK